MPKSYLSKVGELDPRITSIDFSPEVRTAFRDLAAAVHFSEHVDPEMLATIQDWAGIQKPSLQDVLCALPLIAEQVFEHIHATGDKHAKKAWGDICSEMLEKGFTMEKNRWRTK
jgi:hypothetical protein